MTQTPDPKIPADFTRPEERYFGRRAGPPLSGRKEHLMADFLPTLAVPTDAAEASLTVADIFSRSQTEMWLEIGFGKGEHLAWQATQHAHVGIIGCEPYINGVAGLLAQIEDEGADNIRVHADDARQVMRVLADGSLSRIFLIHPDPWPKARHARRRFVNPIMLDEIARLLKPGGEFRVGTDHPVYRQWTVQQMALRDDFIWLADRPADWLTRPDDWPETRYERKAIEGFATYFRYRRV